MRAFGRQSYGRRQADAGAAPGDNGDFSFKLSHVSNLQSSESIGTDDTVALQCRSVQNEI